MPCYNEQEVLTHTIRSLLHAFQRAGYGLELVAVDNGSSDRTGEIIQSWAAKDPAVVYHRVERNEGYGHGILSGLPLCRGPWIGMIPADGQVDAEDVVRLFDAVRAADDDVLGKTRRRFRMDGLRRRIVSVLYNLFARLLWPRLDSLDINGVPKLMPRRILLAMDLQSKNWLLDPEIMIKAHFMGVRILELNVFARMRGSGVSHVHATTCWEFLRYLLAFRFSRRWKRDFQRSATAVRADELPIAKR